MRLLMDAQRRLARPSLFAMIGLVTTIGRAQPTETLIAASIDGAAPVVVNRADIVSTGTCTLTAIVAIRQADGAVRYVSGERTAVRIGDRRIIAEPWTGPITLRWFKVEPRMMHESKGNDPTAPNYLWYTNAYVPGSPRQSDGWIDFDTIHYDENRIEAFADRWSIPADAHPTDQRYDRNRGLGTMRYAVQAVIDGKTVRTPGRGSANYLGIGDEVFRLNIRLDDSFVGYATSYFNVPGIYGSHERQVDRFIGTDCADLLVGAYRRWRGGRLEYTGVNRLVEQMQSLCPVVYLGGAGDLCTDRAMSRKAAIPFVRGAAVVFDYATTSEGWYEHIGILYRDDGDGIVDGGDIILHCGPMEPSLSYLSSQAGTNDRPTRVRVYRWKD
jgi:hypothetical protein